ncbi:MAG: hypothetical protein JWP53_109 [Conexibacter sp.]|jgi:hypothetical protein|nr:hypothetical protein [Conexibacter sp.]
MFTFTKRLVFVALFAASLTSVATAGAATATITGGPNISAAAATSTLLKFHTTNKTWSCTGATGNGSVAASTAGSIPPGFRVGTLTLAFTGCNWAGGLGFTVACQPSALNVNGVTTAGSTRGSLTGISCQFFVTSQTACRLKLAGGVGVTYANPSGGFSGASMVTDTDHQTLAASDSTNGAGGACALLPNDPSARFSNPFSGDLQYNLSPTNLTVNVTP